MTSHQRRFIDYDFLPHLTSHKTSPNWALMGPSGALGSFPFALVCLNYQFDMEEFRALWNSAYIRVLVDGAANRLVSIFCDEEKVDVSSLPRHPLGSIEANALYKRCRFFSSIWGDFSTESTGMSVLFPDVIIGDMDSIHPLILQWLINNNVLIQANPEDQDTTDFHKALTWILRSHNNRQRGEDNIKTIQFPITSFLHPHNIQLYQQQGILNNAAATAATAAAAPAAAAAAISTTTEMIMPPITNCLCYPSFGGRFDQYISLLHVIQVFSEQFNRLILVGENNLVETVAHDTIIGVDSFNDQFHCGLVPLQGPTKAYWTGFKWNLGHDAHTLSLLAGFISLHYLSGMTNVNPALITETEHALSEIHPDAEAAAYELDMMHLISTNNLLQPIHVDDLRQHLTSSSTPALSSAFNLAFGRRSIVQHNDENEQGVSDHSSHRCSSFCLISTEKPLILSIEYNLKTDDISS